MNSNDLVSDDEDIDFFPDKDKCKLPENSFFSSGDELEDFSLLANPNERLDFSDDDERQDRLEILGDDDNINNSLDETCRSRNVSVINNDDRPDYILESKASHSKISKLLTKKMISFIDAITKNLEGCKANAKRLAAILEQFRFSYKYCSKKKEGEVPLPRKLLPEQLKLMKGLPMGLGNLVWKIPDLDVFIQSKSDINIVIEIKFYFLFEAILCELAEFIRNRLEKGDSLQNYAFEEIYSKKKLFIQLKGCNNKFVISCDENVETSQVYNKIKLICNYGKLESRLYYLGHFLLYWADQKSLFEKRIITPEDLLMLVIFFFQMERLVPVLQDRSLFKPSKETLEKCTKKEVYKHLEEINGRREVVKRSVNVCTWFQEPNDIAKKQLLKNDISLGILLAKFFHFYSRSLPFSVRVISISTGTLKPFSGNPLNIYQIEDPFIERRVHRVKINEELYFLNCLTKGYKTIMVDQDLERLGSRE